MGTVPTKPIKQPSRAKSFEALQKHINYVNSVICSICRSSTNESFFLMLSPSHSSTVSSSSIVVYKTPKVLQTEADIDEFTKDKDSKVYKTLDFSKFYRFYDRVQLLAPLEPVAEDQSNTNNRSSVTTDSPQSSTTQDEADSECMICMESAVEVVLPDCNHAFCQKCLEEWTQVSKTCPMCRTQTESDDSLWVMAENPSSDKIFSSMIELLDKL